MKLTWLAGVLVVAGVAVCEAQQPATVVEDVAVVDVTAGRVISGKTIVIEGERIGAIGAGDALKVPGGATRIEGRGLFAIPGLFDCHVHFIDPESFGKMMIVNGVTFVRELGNATDTIVPVRDRLNSGELLGPEMICKGAIIDGDPPIWPFSEPVDTEEEARAAVRKLHAAGVNQIKVYSLLKPEVYRAAVDEAGKLKLRAVGHIPAACTPEDALNAGQHCVEHLSQFDRLVAELVPAEEDKKPRKEFWAGMTAWMRMPRVDEGALRSRLKPFGDAGMYQCPTLVVMAGIGRLAEEGWEKDPRLEYVPNELKSFWSGEMYQGFGTYAGQMVPHMQRMVRAMDEAGVRLVIGTDLANPNVFPGLAVHEEMQLFAGAGVSTASTLRAATIVAAELCGVEKSHGTIEAGKTASMVLLRKNPLEHIRNTLEIEGVFLRGKYFSRADLDALAAEVKAAIAATKPSETDVKLELPGQPIARGTYTAKFQQFDAGSEDFLITRAADGYRVMSHSKPKGGMQPPSVVTVHYSPGLEFAGATYKTLVERPVEVTYTRIGKQIEARAKRGGAELPTQTVDLPEMFYFGAPVSSGDFLAFQALRLEPEQKVETTAVNFGFPDWKLTTTPLKVSREADTELERGGVMVKARLYTTSMKTPMGQFEGRTWTDEKWLVLKAQLTMPFGTVTAELK